jgi:hypothetical protein
MSLPGDLNAVTVTGTYKDPAGMALAGWISLVPSATLTDTTDSLVIPPYPKQYFLTGGAFTTDPLVPTDNSNIAPSGWMYVVTLALQNLPVTTFSVLIPHAPSPVDISTLTPVVAQPALGTYLAVAGGTMTGNLVLDAGLQLVTGAVAGAVLTSDGAGNAAWSPAALSPKPSVQLAATSALPSNTYASGALTAAANGALSIDSVAAAAGDRVLVTAEAAAANNGIYTCTIAGGSSVRYVLTRAPDMSAGYQVPGAFAYVIKGTASAGCGFIVSAAAPVTVGTTAITWEQLTGPGTLTAGTGLTRTGSVMALTVPVTIPDGGTGQASAQSAMDALAGSVTSGTYLRGSGTHAVMAAIQAGDVPTLNQSTTGMAADLSAPLSIAHGGTAAASAQAAINALAGGVTSGSYMRGNGTNVVLSAIQAADVPALLTDTAVKTSAYTAVAGDNVLVSTSGAAVTITTPATPLNKQMFGVKHVIQGTTGGVPNAASVAANTGVTFNDDASTTSTLPMANQSAVYQYDASLAAWVKIYGDTPVGGLDIRYGAAIASLATAGATPAITANTAGTWNVTLSANVTGLTITGATATPSQVLTLNIAQPASGGPFTFPGSSWPGSVVWLAGTAPVIASAASAVTVVTLRTSNGGTTWYGSASAVLPVTGGGTGAATASAALAALGAAALAGATFTGPVAPAVVTLTDSTTITVAATAGNDFRLTLTASGHTLGSPSGGVDGQEIIVQITQGTGGGFTISYGTGYEFSAQLPAPVLSVTAGQVDVLKFLYNAAKGKFFFMAFLGGF